MSFKVSWKLHILGMLISLFICLILSNEILQSFVSLIVKNERIDFTGNIYIIIIMELLLILICVSLIHEFLHAIAYLVFEGKVKIGFKGIYAYTQEVSGIILHRTKFLIVLLSPVTIISVFCLFINNEIGFFAFLLNLFGSTGDILMSIYLCRGNENSYVVDKPYGFDLVQLNSVYKYKINQQ